MSNINFNIENINIRNNNAKQGAGLYIDNNTKGLLYNINIKSNNYINNNKLGDYWNTPIGGGIYLSKDSHININNSTIENNNMYWGGGIFNDFNINDPIRINLTNSTIKNNNNYDIYVIGNGSLLNNHIYIIK